MPRVVAGYKDEARRTILETAAEVFAKNGYTDTTMDDIARALGVSKGAVYQYFDSKDQLFEELCGVTANVIAERLRDAFSGPDLRNAAEGYINIELDKFEQRGVVMFEALARAPRDRSIAEVVGNNYTVVLGVMKRFLEGLKQKGNLSRDLDSAAVAEELIALRHGILATVLLGVSREDAIRTWMNGFDSIVGPFIVKGGVSGK
jgi:AcrR family transcriptional regulator